MVGTLAMMGAGPGGITAGAASCFTAAAAAVLLLHCDGTNGSTTFVDSSASAHTVTANGNAQLDTSQKEFGTASGKFDGSGDYLNLDGSSDFAFGTGDFTIDFWFRLTSGSPILVDLRPSGGGSYPVIFIQSGVIKYFYISTRITGTTTVSTGTWHHVALARASGTTKLFLDGTQEGSDYADSNNYGIGTSRPTFGIDGTDTSSGALNGWLDEIHIMKGTAQWSSNFTPPTLPYCN